MTSLVPTRARNKTFTLGVNEFTELTHIQQRVKTAAIPISLASVARGCGLNTLASVGKEH